MKKIENFDAVEAIEGGGEFKKLPSGGYVGRIESVLNKEEKEIPFLE